MSIMSLDAARPLSAGKIAPPGAVLDPALSQMLASYRRRVVGGVFAFSPTDLDTYLPRGLVSVSPLVAGLTYCLVLGEGEPFLAGPSGEVIAGSIPLLDEARRAACRVTSRTVIAGQLYARSDEGGRPRADDLARLLSAGPSAAVERLAFAGLDVLAGGDSVARMPLGPFADRASLVARVLEGGRLLHAARVESASDGERILALFREQVGGALASSLLLRSASGRLLKLGPPIGVRAVVVGYTERPGGEQVGALLLALTRPGGQLQVVGTCTQVGDEASRRKLFADLGPLEVPSDYKHAGQHGELFRLVNPSLVVDVRAVEVCAEDAAGRALRSATLSFAGDRWSVVALAPTLHLVAPSLAGRLPPKQAASADARLSQVIEHAFVPGADQAIPAPSVATSTVLRREVWVKETRGQKAVRKLVAWKTNKEATDPAFPPYVVHWTDYSPGRKAPLEREVHPVGSAESMNTLADRLIAEHIKKGWEKVG
jgi:hypothetical protein